MDHRQQLSLFGYQLSLESELKMLWATERRIVLEGVYERIFEATLHEDRYLLYKSASESAKKFKSRLVHLS